MPIVAPFHFDDYIETVAFIDDVPAFGCASGEVRLFTDQGEKVVVAHDGLLCGTRALDGKSLLTGGEDGRVKRLSANGDLEEVAHIERKWISSVAAGPNGAIAWCVGREAHVKSVKNDVRSFAHERTVEDVCFAPKGLRIAAARYNGATLNWAGTEMPKQDLEWAGAHTQILFSPDGRYLVSSMQENSLHGWRLTDERHMRMSGYPTKVKSMSFSRGGKWLATSGASSAVVWPFVGKDGPMGKMPKELGHRAESLIVAVACHPKEDVVALGYEDGMVAAVAIGDGKDVLLRHPGKAPVTRLAWDDGGRRLLFGCENGEAGLVDLSV